MGFLGSIMGSVLDQTAPALLKAMKEGGSPRDWERIAINSEDNIKRAIALYLIYENKSYSRSVESAIRDIYFEKKRAFDNANKLLLSSGKFTRMARSFSEYIVFLEKLNKNY